MDEGLAMGLSGRRVEWGGGGEIVGMGRGRGLSVRAAAVKELVFLEFGQGCGLRERDGLQGEHLPATNRR